VASQRSASMAIETKGLSNKLAGVCTGGRTHRKSTRIFWRLPIAFPKEPYA